MHRVQFTVNVVNRGVGLPGAMIGYDADHLHAALREGDGHPMLSFMCSGAQMSVPAEDVISVVYGGATATWCGFCDQSLDHLGASSNPAVLADDVA